MRCRGLLLVWLALPAIGQAEEGDNSAKAARARAVFKQQCARCHGPQLARPKGGFGYVLDLKKLADDPDKVVPGQPEQSTLWQKVHDDEMPPNRPLTQEQKDVIHAWIKAGAPDAPSEEAREPEAQENRGTHFLEWVGRLHVTVIHFPIALLLAAFLGELWFRWRGAAAPAAPVRFCVLLGAVGAAVAAPLGWVCAAVDYPPTFWVTLHRWFGVSTAIGAVLLALLSERDSRRGVRSAWFRLLLFLEAILVSVTGHFGGILVHGPDFLSW